MSDLTDSLVEAVPRLAGQTVMDLRLPSASSAAQVHQALRHSRSDAGAP